jgi:hypothetical protein
MYEYIARYVKFCKECQFRDPGRVQEPLHPTWTSTAWHKVGIDITHMPKDEGKEYLVQARCDACGWPEAAALGAATAKNVAAFIFQDIICRWGVVAIMVIDGGPENRPIEEILLKRYKVKVHLISAYNAKGNGMIEAAHKLLKGALSKMTDGTGKGWVKLLPLALSAERSTVRRSTGMTPYRFLMGQEAILPIELELPTWMTLEWNTVRTTEDLIAMRARQIDRRDEDIQEAAYRLERLRKQNKEYFDEHHVLRDEPLSRGEIVLLHNTKQSQDFSNRVKLAWRWLGPYRIRHVNKNGSYALEELDGTEMKGTVNGNRLKKYYTLEEFSKAMPEAMEIIGQEQEEEVSADEVEDVEVAHTSDGDAASIGNAGSASIPAGWDFAVVI